MSTKFYTELGWLPAPAAEFRKVLKTWPEKNDPAGFLRFLATHSLNIDQLGSLARQLDRARDAGVRFEQLVPYTLGILSNATTEHITPALRATALRHGVLLDTVAAPYGQVMQAATGSVTEFADRQFDAVLCAIDARGFPANPGFLVKRRALVAAPGSIAYLQRVIEGILRQTNAPCIVQTLPAPAGKCVWQSRSADSRHQQTFCGRVQSQLA